MRVVFLKNCIAGFRSVVGNHDGTYEDWKLTVLANSKGSDESESPRRFLDSHPSIEDAESSMIVRLAQDMYDVVPVLLLSTAQHLARAEHRQAVLGICASPSAGWNGLLESLGEGSAESMLRRKLSFKELSQYFHLPIDAASKEMSICPTVLKKICRHHGLPRWPHRCRKCSPGPPGNGTSLSEELLKSSQLKLSSLRSIDRLTDRLKGVLGKRKPAGDE